MPQSTNSAPPSGADFLHLEQELNWRRIHDSNRFQKSGMSSATVALSAVKRNTSPPFRLTLRPKLAWDVTWRQHPDKCKGVKPSAKKDLPWSGVSSISIARTLSPRLPQLVGIRGPSDRRLRWWARCGWSGNTDLRGHTTCRVALDHRGCFCSAGGHVLADDAA